MVAAKGLQPIIKAKKKKKKKSQKLFIQGLAQWLLVAGKPPPRAPFNPLAGGYWAMIFALSVIMLTHLSQHFFPN